MAEHEERPEAPHPPYAPGAAVPGPAEPAPEADPGVPGAAGEQAAAATSYNQPTEAYEVPAVGQPTEAYEVPAEAPATSQPTELTPEAYAQLTDEAVLTEPAAPAAAYTAPTFVQPPAEPVGDPPPAEAMMAAEPPAAIAGWPEDERRPGRGLAPIAYAALALSLLALAWAAGLLPLSSIGNKQLKSNAVTSDKVADGSLTGADFNKLPTGPRGPAGPAGKPGKPGPAGQGISTTPVSKASASDTGADKTVQASCPSGQKVIGGGATTTGSAAALKPGKGKKPASSSPVSPVVALSSNGPTADNDGWTASARAAATQKQPWSLMVTAICQSKTKTQSAPAQGASGSTETTATPAPSETTATPSEAETTPTTITTTP